MAYEILKKYAPNATQKLIDEMADGKITQNQLSTISSNLTVEMLKNMNVNITAGKLQQIANDLYGVLGENYELVGECYAQIQNRIYAAEKLEMQATKAEMSKKRVERIAERLKIATESLAKVIVEKDVSSMSRQAYGDSVKVNTDQASEAGLKTYIVRTLGSGKNCEWCRDLAGKYEYGVDVRSGDDVFRRHDNCNCTIECVCEKATQKNSNKASYQIDKSEAKELEKQQLNTESPQAEAAEKSALDEIFGLTEDGESGIINLVSSNGIQINSNSWHLINESMSNRNIELADIKDALINTLHCKEVKIDEKGRFSQQLIGENATVVINPETGNIITAWKTGTNTVKKYKK
ncbi:MAG: hypothetical protein LUE12_09880 [Ruminococcus sp.]|nr:hypothetical protein [Ruminococcus sp.]